MAIAVDWDVKPKTKQTKPILVEKGLSKASDCFRLEGFLISQQKQM